MFATFLIFRWMGSLLVEFSLGRERDVRIWKWKWKVEICDINYSSGNQCAIE